MSRSDTWMPLYVGDYLAATTRLTTEQHGAYFLLLLDYWKNGPPPNDDAVLAQIARMTAASWRKAKPALIGFFTVEDGKLIQRRVEKERERSATVTEERSKAGKRGAAKRWGEAKPKNGKAIANAIGLPLANGQQTDAPSHPHCSNEQIETPNGVYVVSDETPGEQPIEVQEVVDAWNLTAEQLGLAKVKTLSAERRQKVKARIREHSLEDFQSALAAIGRSSFLRGESKGGWKADFDFFVQKSSFIKLVEGSYDH